jgi:hypothetical protein
VIGEILRSDLTAATRACDNPGDGAARWVAADERLWHMQYHDPRVR